MSSPSQSSHPDRAKTVALRRSAREQLSILSPSQKSALWAAIRARLEATWIPQLLAEEAAPSGGSPPLTIALFHPLSDEWPVLELVPILEARLKRSPRFLFPRISAMSPPHLEFHVCTPAGLQPDPGAWGIFEPAETDPRAELSEANWVLVPGLVFGEGGERIGRGKGFYDHALAQAPGLRRLAVAAEFQIHPAPPQHAGDQRMDWIVTESRLILPACASRQNRA